MMYMPSLFGGSIFDEWMNEFDRHFFNRSGEREAVGNNQLMKEDIKEHEDHYELSVDLPGYRKEDLKAELKDGYLTISAIHNDEKEEKDKKGRYLRRERYTGSATRSFYVGENLTQGEVGAKFENGILTLTLPKKEMKRELPEQHLISIEG